MVETDFSKNPVSQRTMVPTASTDKLMGDEAAKAALGKVSGFVPLANRTNGTAKLVAFHIFNGLSFGIVGQIGALCANSQAMGSQKQHNIFKDFGQTYLNATVGRTHTDFNKLGQKKKNTFRGETALRGMTKFWSEGLGAVTGILVHPFTQIAYNNHRARLNGTFSQQFRAKFDRPPSPETLKGMSVEKLLDMSHRENQKATEAAKKEYADIIAKRQADGHAAVLTVSDIEKGSDSFKAFFAWKVDSEFATENLVYKDWAKQATKDIPNALKDRKVLKDPRSTYRLSKFELMAAHSQLAGSRAYPGINISYEQRGIWDNLAKTHLADFKQRWNDLARDHQQCKRDLATLTPGTQSHVMKQAQIDLLETQLEQMKTEKFQPDVSRAFGVEVQKSYDVVYRLLGDAASRMAKELAN